MLGRRIAEARTARGKTQEDVARLLGYSRPTSIAIEKGTRGQTLRGPVGVKLRTREVKLRFWFLSLGGTS